MPNTNKSNVFIPEVVSGMIKAGLPSAIKFKGIMEIDSTLVGRPGDTVTVPKWEYIGDAEDLAEGATIDPTQMAHTVQRATVKKVAKSVSLTDEALNSGYGDPKGEAIRQITVSIASKMDADCVSALSTTKLKYDGSEEIISYAGVVKAVGIFNEEQDTEKVLFVSPAQITQLRLDPLFIDKSKYGNDVMATGEIGMFAGCRVVTSRKIKASKGKFENYIVQLTPEATDGLPSNPAVKAYIKADTEVETARPIGSFTTVCLASKHYVVALSNESKVVKAIFKVA